MLGGIPRVITLILLLPLLLTACQPAERAVSTAELFIPPTLVATPFPSPLPSSTPSPPTPTPPCEDNLVFLEDVTIPDGTVVLPGEEIDKRWLVQNAGSCNWDDRYRVNLVGGASLNATSAQALFPARSGTDVEIQIIFTAPDEPGIYRSAWQAFNQNEVAFGDEFYIEIVVESPTPTPEVTEEPIGM